jgi:hypothetical protein
LTENTDRKFRIKVSTLSGEIEAGFLNIKRKGDEYEVITVDIILST